MVGNMPEILVLYYSRGGSVARLARQVARGVGEVEGMGARLRSVPPVAVVTQQAAPPEPEEERRPFAQPDWKPTTALDHQAVDLVHQLESLMTV